jgi:hypothetical protein
MFKLGWLFLWLVSEVVVVFDVLSLSGHPFYMFRGSQMPASYDESPGTPLTIIS